MAENGEHYLLYRYRDKLIAWKGWDVMFFLYSVLVRFLSCLLYDNIFYI